MSLSSTFIFPLIWLDYGSRWLAWFSEHQFLIRYQFFIVFFVNHLLKLFQPQHLGTWYILGSQAKLLPHFNLILCPVFEVSGAETDSWIFSWLKISFNIVMVCLYCTLKPFRHNRFPPGIYNGLGSPKNCLNNAMHFNLTSSIFNQ